MLDKKILTEVLGLKEDVIRVWQDESFTNIIYYKTKRSAVCNINIYELAFKCKEWASKKGYYIYSAPYADAKVMKAGSIDVIVEFTTTTDQVLKELKDIFKAIEWVYNETNKCYRKCKGVKNEKD